MKIEFESYEKTISELLNNAGLIGLIKNQKKIVLKPNLTLNKKFPVTTNVKFAEEVLKFCLKNSKANIIIAEGSGGANTFDCYRDLGYEDLAEKYNIKLVDLNIEETERIEDKRFKKFKFIEYPKILLDSFLISLPVLKEHSEAKVTISLKNMLGAFPSRYHKNSEGNWKMKMHNWSIDYSIHDVLVCKFPDFAICDASVGQIGGKVHGTPKRFGLVLSGGCVEVDKEGCEVLGHDWRDIRHIKFAEELRNRNSV